MERKLVIFDLDGTIANTAPGIFDSYRHVARWLGSEEHTDEELVRLTTGRLDADLARIYSLTPEQTSEAINEFLRYYNTEGFLNAEVYPGIHELILDIHAHGIKLAVATMKLEELAVQQIEHWGLSDCFVSVNGADMFGSFTKSDLIDKSLYSAGVQPEDALMIGDTPGDYKGAAKSGVPFIAVTYGFAFNERICRSHCITYAKDADDLRRMIFRRT